MAIDIVVPTLGESVNDATIARWMKQTGEAIAQDEPIVELETDKVTLEVPYLSRVRSRKSLPMREPRLRLARWWRRSKGGAPAVAAQKGAAPTASKAATPAPQKPAAPVAAPSGSERPLSPAVRRLIEENGIDPGKIRGTGVDGRLTKADVMAALKAGTSTSAAAPTGPVLLAPARQMPREMMRRVRNACRYQSASYCWSSENGAK